MNALDTRAEVVHIARSLVFVANRTGMTVEKCEKITDEAAAMLRRLIDRAETAERERDAAIERRDSHWRSYSECHKMMRAAQAALVTARAEQEKPDDR